MEFIQKKSVVIYANPEFLIIKTLSGYRRLAVDPNAKIHQLLPTATPLEIGVCMLNALDSSRLINIDDAAVFFNRESLMQRYEKWIADLFQEFSYSSRRALFNKMRCCNADEHEGFITIEPTFHDKLEGFSGEGVDESSYVKVPSSSPPEEIGQGVLLALSRCTGKGAL